MGGGLLCVWVRVVRGTPHPVSPRKIPGRPACFSCCAATPTGNPGGRSREAGFKVYLHTSAEVLLLVRTRCWLGTGTTGRVCVCPLLCKGFRHSLTSV